MAQFVYQGIDKTGKKVTAAVEAQNEGELRMMLRTQGVRPTKITKPGMIAKATGGGGGMSLINLLTFTRQLQVLISSGVPIVQGLEILEGQCSDRGMRRLVGNVRERVSGGTFLWEALAVHPKAFPKIYVALIRAGEASGSIDQMLKRLGMYLENTDRMRKMIKAAMMYPAIVVSIGGGVISIMMVFVIPKFESMLKSSGQELPGPTKLVMNMSHFMIDNFTYILVGGIGGGILAWRFFTSTEGKAILDRVFFKAPIFGALMQKSAVAKFSRTMQTLLSAGVNLIDAIDVCKATIGNAVLEDAVGKIRAEIEAGKTLGQVIGRLDVFPKMAVQMISVGESTGALDKMLERVADFYEEEVDTMVGGMSKMIEPIILVFLGGAVGGMMIAMYLPIFSAAGAAGGGG